MQDKYIKYSAFKNKVFTNNKNCNRYYYDHNCRPLLAIIWMNKDKPSQ